MTEHNHGKLEIRECCERIRIELDKDQAPPGAMAFINLLEMLAIDLNRIADAASGYAKNQMGGA